MNTATNCPHTNTHNPNGCTWCASEAQAFRSWLVQEGPSLANVEAKAKIQRMRKRAEARREARRHEANGRTVAARLARAGAR